MRIAKIEDKVLSFIITYKVFFILGAIFALFSGVTYYGYGMFFTNLKNKAGERYYAASQQDFSKLSSEEVIEILNKEYAKTQSIWNLRSKLAPLIYLNGVEELINRNEIKEALKCVDKILPNLPDGIIKSVLLSQKGSLLLFSNDTASEGIAILEKESLVGTAISKRLALFHLHQYYWNNRTIDPNFEKALETGSQFLTLADEVSETSNKYFNSSSCGKIVQKHLKLLQ